MRTRLSSALMRLAWKLPRGFHCPTPRTPWAWITMASGSVFRSRSPKPEAGLAHVDAESNQVRIYPDRGWPAGRVGSEFWLYQHRGFDFSPLVAIAGETVW